ncbi:MAG: proton-conducting transporter membrane subunit [Hyphomonadaceae bacterium]
MIAIALNPGFVMMAGALLLLGAPQTLRAPIMVAAAIGALGLLLSPDFGRYDAFAQIGLQMVPLNLDELSQVFGLAFIGATILIALYGGARDRRFEDAAILLLAGAATAALFVGDLVSFVAAAALAGLAAAWIVFCVDDERAQRAGARLLLWQGLEGLLLLAGVAFQLSDGLRNEFGQMDARSIGGALFLGGLAIRVGAPLAHVWLKDVVSNASSTGATALAIFPAMIGVYGLARAFPGEPALVYGALGMIVIGSAFACAESDLRRAAAYSLLAQIGLAIAAIGFGAPMAVAGAAAHAFALCFAYGLIFMALGALLRRFGTTDAAGIAGAARAAPLTTFFLMLGGLSAAATPGLAGYASYAVLHDALGRQEWLVLALLAPTTIALTAAHTACRPVLAALRAPPVGAGARQAVPAFAMLLGMVLAAFLCLVVGLAPDWLYGLTPPPVRFAPFTPGRLGAVWALIGAAGASFIALRALRLTPPERPLRLLDMDALYRGPLAGAGRWAGVVLLRLYGVWQSTSAAFAHAAGEAFTSFARGGDRPYGDKLAAAASFAAVAGLLAIIFATAY